MKINEITKIQPDCIKLLKNGYATNHLSHAYLFIGDEGCGMFEAAIYMAMLLLCEGEEKPCLKCHNCLRIEKNNHLNVNVLSPSNDLIRREQIDDFIHELMMTSLEAGPQIGIIKDADKMNVSAENALLKVLEEPAPNHYIFLLTSSPENLLDTIISRTQEIRFKPIPKKYIINTLQDSGVDLDIAYVLSYITSDIDSSKQLIEEGKIYTILSLAKEITKIIASNKDPFVYFFKNKQILLEESNKKYHRIFLDILQLINKEIINKYNGLNTLYFNDVVSLYDLEKIDTQKVLSMMDIINKYQERLNSFVNGNLFYTSLLIELNR